MSAAISARIRAAREAAGLTQQQLADGCGLDRTNVVHLEAGRRGVNVATLVKIAAALGCTLDDLAGMPKKSTRRAR